MNCEEFQERMADYLAGGFGPEDAADFQGHLEGCAVCRDEAETLARTWQALGLLREEGPGPALRRRFYESLEAWRQGAREPARKAWWLRPAVLAAPALALLAAGFFVGRLGPSTEIAEMRGEMRNMRQVVTLALLQQQSASDRLRGVDFGAAADRSDTEVLSALLYTLDHDTNVNVRLAAVDALSRFARAPMVRTGVDRSLARQDSPLVQIALIDLLVSSRDRAAVSPITALLRSPQVNDEVKEHAREGLRQLQ